MNSAYSARKRGPILAPKTVVILRRLSVYGGGRDALITRRTLISTRFATIRISWRPVLRRYYVPQIRATPRSLRHAADRRKDALPFVSSSSRIGSPLPVLFVSVSYRTILSSKFVSSNATRSSSRRSKRLKIDCRVTVVARFPRNLAYFRSFEDGETTRRQRPTSNHLNFSRRSSSADLRRLSDHRRATEANKYFTECSNTERLIVPRLNDNILHSTCPSVYDLSYDNSRPRATRSTMEYPTERDSIVACNRKRPCRGRRLTITGVTMLLLYAPTHFMLATVLFVLLFPGTWTRDTRFPLHTYSSYSKQFGQRRRLLFTSLIRNRIEKEYITDQSSTTTTTTFVFLDTRIFGCAYPSPSSLAPSLVPLSRLLFAQRVSSQSPSRAEYTHDLTTAESRVRVN